jgi:hypothetical protein
MLARFEGFDDVVQTRQIGHFLKSPIFGRHPRRSIDRLETSCCVS